MNENKNPIEVKVLLSVIQFYIISATLILSFILIVFNPLSDKVWIVYTVSAFLLGVAIQSVKRISLFKNSF